MGIHISHSSQQQELPRLFENIQRIEKEFENLITMLNQQMDLVYQQFYQLNGGIRSKCQKSKQQFLYLNSKQMSSFFADCILFNQFDQKIIEKSKKDFQDSMENYSDLKLYFNYQLFIKQDLKSIIPELNYCPISNQDIHKSGELYQKAYKLKIQHSNSIIYWNDDNFVEVIKVFNQLIKDLQVQFMPMKMIYYKYALKIDCSNHLGRQGIVSDQHHYDSSNKKRKVQFVLMKLFITRMLGEYMDSIIWADNALLLDSKDFHSLYCKGDSLRQKLKSINLRQIKMFKEAMEVIDESIKVNPNDFDSLWTKGKCLNQIKHI